MEMIPYIDDLCSNLIAIWRTKHAKWTRLNLQEMNNVEILIKHPFRDENDKLEQNSLKPENTQTNNLRENKATRSPEISREQVQKLTPQFLLYIYWI